MSERDIGHMVEAHGKHHHSFSALDYAQVVDRFHLQRR